MLQAPQLLVPFIDSSPAVGPFSGRIKSYNPKQGYGFIECPDARAQFGRDVFIHKAQMGELLGRFVGPGTKLEPTALKMQVQFSVEVNRQGMPQARDVVHIGDTPSAGGVGKDMPPQAGDSLASLWQELPVDPVPLSPPPAEPQAPQLLAGSRAAGQAADITEQDVDPLMDPSTHGYRGRGGTIRIVHEEGGGMADNPNSPALAISAGPVIRRAGAKRGPGGGGGGQQRERRKAPPRTTAGTSSASNAKPQGGSTVVEVGPVEPRERSSQETSKRAQRNSKQNAGDGSSSSPQQVESKRRGYKDPYFRQELMSPARQIYPTSDGQPYVQQQAATVGWPSQPSHLPPQYPVQQHPGVAMPMFRVQEPHESSPMLAFNAPYQTPPLYTSCPPLYQQQYQSQPLSPLQQPVSPTSPPTYSLMPGTPPGVPAYPPPPPFGTVDTQLSIGALPSPDALDGAPLSAEHSPPHIGQGMLELDSPALGSNSAIPEAVTPGSLSDDDIGSYQRRDAMLMHSPIHSIGGPLLMVAPANYDAPAMSGVTAASWPEMRAMAHPV